MTYTKHLGKKNAPTPQNQPIPGTVANSAGGYAFPVDDWKRLDRFLVLGAEGGSYYASERKLTIENAQAVIRCISADGKRAVARMVEISDSGRAPKNEPAIFALALAFAHGDPDTRHAAAESLPKVCRIGTHLFHFAAYVDSLRGWGRGLRRAVANWYLNATPAQLALQAVKYQQRDGWSHRDLLRLAHPVPRSEEQGTILNWIAKGWESVEETPHPMDGVRVIWAFERAKTADLPELLRLIEDYQLPREAIPTEKLTEPKVWEALLPHMGLTALLRNLGNLSKLEVLAVNNSNPALSFVLKTLSDPNKLRKARVHPVEVLTALLTYQQGHGVRGKGEWTPVPKVVDALDAVFYASFGNVEPTHKRLMLALDVSGSMAGGMIAGVPGLSPRVGSAAMAMITAATEQNAFFTAFQTTLTPLSISPRQRLDDIVKRISGLPFGGTDCSLPMIWALEKKMAVDAFIVYTDSETWAGKIHPSVALREYREKTGIAAKLIVVGMVANNFSIADPDDGGMLDVVGFDTAAPNLMSDFIRE